MLITRVAHVLIVGVVATAVVAIVLVLRPETASHPPALEFQQVVNYSKYGVVDRIDAKGQVLTVHFRDGFDTKTQFGTDTHTFETSLPSGDNVAAVLAAAGVPSDSAGGPTVTVHQP